MLRILLLLAALLSAAPTVGAGAAAVAPATVFTPLHTYYLSPTGSDRNSGLTPALAWATPNHAGLVCGDVIIAAPGAYSPNGFNVATTPRSCPSKSGGIDGTGGIFFATVLCARPFACTVAYNNAHGNGFPAISISASFWAWEGWAVDATGYEATAGCFAAMAAGSQAWHHVAFINDICTDASQGFYNGGAANIGDAGLDYIATVGSIAYMANQRNDGYTQAAFDYVCPYNSDLAPGPHMVMIGNFGVNNQAGASGGQNADVEGIMLDTFQCSGYANLTVVKNNLIYHSGAQGMQITAIAPGTSSAAKFHIAQNTFFANAACVPYNNAFVLAEFGGQFNNPTHPWTITLANNIMQTYFQHAQCNSTKAPVYGYVVGGTTGSPGSTRIVSSGNVIYSPYGTHELPFDDFARTTGAILADAEFRNPADLLANHIGKPDCAGFANAAACMGWSYSTLTAAPNSVIDDLTPTASGAVGKGYQPPGRCAPDPDYPIWLKGVVYLSVADGVISENPGLVTKPCGL